MGYQVESHESAPWYTEQPISCKTVSPLLAAKWFRQSRVDAYIWAAHFLSYPYPRRLLCMLQPPLKKTQLNVLSFSAFVILNDRILNKLCFAGRDFVIIWPMYLFMQLSVCSKIVCEHQEG